MSAPRITSDEVDRLIHALASVDRLTSEQLLTAAHERTSLLQLTEELVTPTLEQMSKSWERGELSLAEVYMGSRICEDVLKGFTKVSAPLKREQPRIGIVSLKDHHTLGKKIVASIMCSSGFEVYDLGHGASIDEVVSRVEEDRLEVLLVSTLMLPSALSVGQLRRKLDQAGLHPKIIVGGAPFRFDSELWREVGADAMGVGAADAVSLISKICGDRVRA